MRADASRVKGDLKGAQPGITSAIGAIGVKLGATLAAAFGAGAAMALGRESIALAEVQINAQQRLAATITATGAAAGFTAKQLQGFASDLQSITTFGDEAILDAGAKLLTFKSIQGDVFKSALKAAMDLSAVGFGDLNSTVLQLGKALEDPAIGMTALTRVGVTFSEVQKVIIKDLVKEGKIREAQVVLLKTVEGQVKGVAEAMAKTPVGKLQQMRNVLGDMKEELGKLLIPLQQSLVELMMGLVKALTFVARLFKANNYLLLKTVKILGVVVLAMLAYRAATKAAAAAQAVLMALTGPMGWAMLAAGIVVAAVAIAGVNEALADTTKEATEAAAAIKGIQKAGEDAVKGVGGVGGGVGAGVGAGVGGGVGGAGGAGGGILGVDKEGADRLVKVRQLKVDALYREGKKVEKDFQDTVDKLNEISASRSRDPYGYTETGALDETNKQNAALARQKEITEELIVAEKRLEAAKVQQTKVAKQREAIQLSEEARVKQEFEDLLKIDRQRDIDDQERQKQKELVVKEAAKDRRKVLLDEGAAIKQAVRTPEEILQDERQHIFDLFAASAIDKESAARAITQAEQRAGRFDAPEKRADFQQRFAGIPQMGKILQSEFAKGEKKDQQAEMVKLMEEDKKAQLKLLEAVEKFGGIGALVAGDN